MYYTTFYTISFVYLLALTMAQGECGSIGILSSEYFFYMYFLFKMFDFHSQEECRSVGSYDHGIRIFYTTSEGRIWGYLESLFSSNDFGCRISPHNRRPVIRRAPPNRETQNNGGFYLATPKPQAQSYYDEALAATSARPPIRVGSAHTRQMVTV